MIKYSFTTFSIGDADLCRKITIPMATELEKIMPNHTGELPEPLRIPPMGPSNSVVGVLILGITLFAKDLLGEAAKDTWGWIKSSAKRFWTGTSNSKPKKLFNFSIWYSDKKVLVSVSAVEDSFDLIPIVHANALIWIIANDSEKPVHHYVIEGGRVNVAPILSDHIKDVLDLGDSRTFHSPDGTSEKVMPPGLEGLAYVLRCTPGRFPWDDWEKAALTAGVPKELAVLGRTVMREAFQHAWSARLISLCGWRDQGKGMIKLALRSPAKARERWQRLLDTDGNLGALPAIDSP